MHVNIINILQVADYDHGKEEIFHTKYPTNLDSISFVILC